MGSIKPMSNNDLERIADAMTIGHWIPAQEHTIEIEIERSRFIATAWPVESVEQARALLAARRHAHPDANHHVYAFRVGFGQSVIDGMSDDGEPTGTSGPPVLAVIRGSGLGDVLVVVTRYFGGTKLGTGGLVRAYTAAASAVLSEVPRSEKVKRVKIALMFPYSAYTVVKRILAEIDARLGQEIFDTSVELHIEIVADKADTLYVQLRDLTAGELVFEPLP
jgi:uncharacterized YigZ family protein